MPYRRNRSDTIDELKWRKWINVHGNKLVELGLPLGTYKTSKHWSDFIWSGIVDNARYPDCPFWSFTSLDSLHKKALLCFLNENKEFAPENASLLDFLRHNITSDNIPITGNNVPFAESHG